MSGTLLFHLWCFNITIDRLPNLQEEALFCARSEDGVVFIQQSPSEEQATSSTSSIWEALKKMFF